MSLFGFTDDPVADFERHDREQQEAASKLPKCVYCRQRINDEEYYDIDGDLMCYECLVTHHRKWTDEYEG